MKNMGAYTLVYEVSASILKIIEGER